MRRFTKIRPCRPARPTYQPKVKIWDNFGNFWSIELIFGIRVHFEQPLSTGTFRNNPTIFPPTSATEQKIACRGILKLP